MHGTPGNPHIDHNIYQVDNHLKYQQLTAPRCLYKGEKLNNCKEIEEIQSFCPFNV